MNNDITPYKHGGSRPNSGRNKLPYETAVLRIPRPCLDAVNLAVKNFKDGLKK